MKWYRKKYFYLKLSISGYNYNKTMAHIHREEESKIFSCRQSIIFRCSS